MSTSKGQWSPGAYEEELAYWSREMERRTKLSPSPLPNDRFQRLRAQVDRRIDDYRATPDHPGLEPELRSLMRELSAAVAEASGVRLFNGKKPQGSYLH